MESIVLKNDSMAAQPRATNMLKSTRKLPQNSNISVNSIIDNNVI